LLVTAVARNVNPIRTEIDKVSHDRCAGSASQFAVSVHIVDVHEGAIRRPPRIDDRSGAELGHLGTNQYHAIAG